jgi:hypothetical protein
LESGIQPMKLATALKRQRLVSVAQVWQKLDLPMADLFERLELQPCYFLLASFDVAKTTGKRTIQRCTVSKFSFSLWL